MRRVQFLLIFSILLLMISACSGGEAAIKDTDYDATKKMVVDILQTEDGKKALREILADEKMQEKLVIDSSTVKSAIDETLNSEKSKDMWKKLFEDPKFVETYYKSVEEDQKNLMKSLMNDSEYQKQMMDLLKNPEMEDQVLQVLKSQQFRKHLEDTIRQTLESPLFLAKVQEALLKAVEEQGNQNQGNQSGGQSGQGGGSSGGPGGGGGSGDGGSGGGGGQ
ncbi:spore germination lipoprotein GerD [Ornithinibacillus bavariensis]|uniref:Germination protein GerD n=1 Tax=Ornithinibacillus bavariensis TaxID=545502 RepID=A0A919XC64_9BACI|nr:spore germination lipoprotein GerD [Ornithinibacillus bavariensis]GIO28733.1 germination protein GerD [Ornithinibacillus bavariensis]